MEMCETPPRPNRILGIAEDNTLQTETFELETYLPGAEERVDLLSFPPPFPLSSSLHPTFFFIPFPFLPPPFPSPPPPSLYDTDLSNKPSRRKDKK